MDIKNIVANIVRKFETRNPMIIAEKMDMLIFKENLGTINGYYALVFNVQTIHLNKNLSCIKQKVICAHELGHAILHPNLSTCVITNTTLINLSIYEKQADFFASYLLIPDKILSGHGDCEIEEIAKGYDIPSSLLRGRITM